MKNPKKNDGNKKMIVPYVVMDRVIETIQALYKEGSRETELQKVADLLGCKVSNINNVTPTLTVLGLAETKNGKLTLTTDGMAFAEAHSASQEEKCKKIIKKALETSEVLTFVRSLLEAKSQLSGEEIGRALSERFNKKWKDVRSYRAYGNSCASIISYAGIGFYDRGMLSLNPTTQAVTGSIYSPEIGYNAIIGLLKVLNAFDRAKISDISKRLGKDEKTTWARLTVCTKLNLVTKEIQGVYSITDFGRKLIDPTASSTAKTNMFRDCLMSSSYGDVIKKIAASANEITIDSLGDALSYQLRREWSTQTKKLYSKKFLTWLSAAEIITKIDKSHYRVRNNNLETVQMAESNREEAKSPDCNFIFAVGRAIGTIESLSAQDKNKVFNDGLSELKLLLGDHKDLHMMLDMLQKNYELSVSSKNQSIFETNMNFVRQKIKDRLNLSVQEN